MVYFRHVDVLACSSLHLRGADIFMVLVYIICEGIAIALLYFLCKGMVRVWVYFLSRCIAMVLEYFFFPYMSFLILFGGLA